MELKIEETGQKLPVPKVLAVVVALGVIILGAVYFIVISKDKGGQKTEDLAAISKAETQQNQKGQGGSSQSPSGMAVVLSEVASSGQSGIAVLGEKDGKVLVSVGISNGQETIQPVHIHKGSCSNSGDIKYSLKDIAKGSSETTLNVGMKQLRGELPLALDVHKSASEMDTPVACGDLK